MEFHHIVIKLKNLFLGVTCFLSLTGMGVTPLCNVIVLIDGHVFLNFGAKITNFHLQLIEF